MIELVLAAGLVNWLVTTIIVESELGRPLRGCVARRREAAGDRGRWRWADYLLACHLCVGVWVGIVEAAWLGPIGRPGVLGYAFAALLVKAVGHLVLELRPQAWYRHP